MHKISLAYNTSVNSIIGYTPFHLMFGQQVCLSVDVMYATVPFSQQSRAYNEYAVVLQKLLTSAYDLARLTAVISDST